MSDIFAYGCPLWQDFAVLVYPQKFDSSHSLIQLAGVHMDRFFTHPVQLLQTKFGPTSEP